MKYFAKCIVVCLMFFLSLNNLFSCTTYKINPPTVIQPSCGSNGSISISTTPSLSPGSDFYVYKDGVYIVKLSGTLANINSLAPGTYKVIVVDNATGCKDSANNIILYPATNTLKVTYTVDSAKCDTSKDLINGGKITLVYSNAVLPVNVNWNYSSTNHDSIAKSLPKGIYSATVIDKNNCKAVVDSIKVPSKEILITTDTTITPSTCNMPNGKIDLYLKGGYGQLTYQWIVKDTWNFDIMPLDSLSSGVYTCRVNDELKCKTYNFAINVPVFPGPDIDIKGTDSICANEGFGELRTVILKGDSLQMSFTWTRNDTLFSTSKNIGSLTAGVYKVVATDVPSKCSDSQTHTIYTYPEKKIRIIPDKYQIVKNQKTFIRIDSPKGLYNLVWAPTENVDILVDSNIWVYPDTTTYYSLVAKYGPGCITKAFQYIEVVRPIDSLVFPNLFTPNGDNVNDKYFLRGKINDNDNFEFKVYDRWGNNVFNAYRADFQWDGNDEKGKPLNYGVYTYLVKYTVVSPTTKVITQSGQIMLER